MNLLGSAIIIQFRFAIAISVILLTAGSLHADDTGIKDPPVIQAPADSTVIQCAHDPICFEIIATDIAPFGSITISLLEGPITFEPVTGVTPLTVNDCFVVDSSGVYRFIWQVEDINGLTDVDTVIYTVFTNGPPVIAQLSFSVSQCDLKVERFVQLSATDEDGDVITFVKQSGPGTIDPVTGLITYIPDTSGTFTFEVSAEDSCGGNVVTVTDQIVLNTLPQVTASDQYFEFCSLEEVCFDIFTTDADGDDVLLEQLEGLGQLTMTSDSSGQTCFLPADVDTAYYMFIYRATDSCLVPGRGDEEKITYDTVNVTVVINRPPELVCPEPITFLACQLDTFYFEIEVFDFEGGSLQLSIPSQNAEIDGTTVAVIGESSAQFDVVIVAVDDCENSDSCIVPVTIIANSPPDLTVADDFSVIPCQPQVICFPASVYDFELNLDSVWTNYGTFNSDNEIVCFNADSSGIYEIILYAVDFCGALTTKTTLVTVDINDAPEVIFETDAFEFNICRDPEVCFGAFIADSENNFAYISVEGGGATYDPQRDTICFVPDTPGVYVIIALAGDLCGEVAADTITITVIGHDPPEISLGNDTSFSQCQPEEICIDVNTVPVYDSLTTTLGIFDADNNTICFTPDLPGLHRIIATVYDSCGAIGVDTINVDVAFKSAPKVYGMPDSTLYLCYPTFVCLPIVIEDADNDIVSITSNIGSYSNESVCFAPYDSGNYTIIVTVTDSCGFTASDTAVVRILTDLGTQVKLPDDTTLFHCELDTIGFPVSGIPENSEITVTGINTWYEATETDTMVFFYAECGTTNHITITATTACGSYSDDFVVITRCNSAPLVAFPRDTSILICDTPIICIPVGVSDLDDNLTSVQAVGGTYDPLLHTVCFTADTAGVYRLVVNASDSCGLTGTDTIHVSVSINEAPVCIPPGDTAVLLCEIAEIILPVEATDADNNLVECTVESGPGSIIDGFWRYTPQSEGEFTVVIQCLDECGAVCVDSVKVTVDLNEAPQCDSDVQQTFFQCAPDSVFIPVGAIDPEGNLAQVSLFSGPGAIINGRWAYLPLGDETVTAVVRFVDDCGEFCDQIINATFVMNQAPVASCPNDTTIFVCDLSDICIKGFNVTDVDNNLISVTASGGILHGDSVCFTPVVGINRITLIATDECGLTDSCVTEVTVVLNAAPVCEIPNDSTIALCETTEICLPVVGSDIDGNLLGCELVTNIGALENGSWCYTPGQSEVVTVTVRCTDQCGATCEETFIITFVVNEPPVLSDGGSSAELCYSGELRTFTMTADDPEGDLLTYTILSGFGSVDASTGIVTYMADTAGVYSFVLEVLDECLADTATFADTISFNQLPISFGYDTTLFLCAREEISLSFAAFDPDGDPLTINLVEGPGQFSMDSDSSGIVTFLPDDVPTQRHYFVFCVSDSCQQANDGQLPGCIYDTVAVTVITNRAPVIVCDTPQTFFSCGSGSYCFDVSATDGEVDALIFSIISPQQFASIDGQTVCVTGINEGTIDVVVEVRDDCSADTCVVPVTIVANSPPDVATGADSSLFLCQPQEICLEATITDAEQNIIDIYTNFGSYDDIDNKLCFFADSSGIYEIILTAEDSCGEVVSDTTIVTVNINLLPIVDLGDDLSFTLCSDSSVCFSVLIDDDNTETLSIGFGNYNPLDSTICFNADSSGVYTVEVILTDICGETAIDQVTITVIGHEPPIVDLGVNRLVYLCDTADVCVDVKTASSLVSVNTNLGVYDPVSRQVCFSPDSSGIYHLEVEVEDTCGAIGIGVVDLEVYINNAPTIADLNDTTIYLCFPEFICLPLDVRDVDGNLTSVTSSIGSVVDGQVCFSPFDSGLYIIAITATDSCGLQASTSVQVYIETDLAISIEVPNDTTVFMCSRDTLSFPVHGIPVDAEVSITGINTWIEYVGTDTLISFYAECATTNHIRLTVTTGCGVFEEEFVVVTRCNSAPLVSLPPTTSVPICEPSPVCVTAAVTDLDDNIDSIWTNIGVYDPLLHSVCFFADSIGSYTIRLSAVDECGVVGWDETTVIVTANSAPEIAYILTDSVFRQCNLEEICVPVAISDVDSNLAQVEVSFGSYDSLNQRWCFTPSSVGDYCLDIVATDICGDADTAQICFTVEAGDSVFVSCIDTLINICRPEEVCLPLSIAGSYQQISTSFGTVVNDLICFTADSSGLYLITVTAEAECNIDSCTYAITVNIADSVTITCPAVAQFLLCGPETLEFAFEISSSVTDVQVSPPAEIIGQTVRLPISAPGSYVTTLIASGPCGTDSCSFTVVADFNSAPVVVGMDTGFVICELTEICLPFTVTDVDDNVDSITTSEGILGDSIVCFTPQEFGLHKIIVTAWDSCLAVGVDTLQVVINAGGFPAIICPEGVQYDTLCAPDSVHVGAPVTPDQAIVTVFPNGSYDPVTGQVSVFVENSGVMLITVIAVSDCAADTCEFELDVTIAVPPAITCPERLDTLVCISKTESICRPVIVSGTAVEVEVEAPATYSAGLVCFPVDTAGLYVHRVIAFNQCGADTCFDTVYVSENLPPVLYLPADTTINGCPQDTQLICIDGIFAEDPGSLINLIQTCGTGQFDLFGLDSGQLCFSPDSFGTYQFCFEATDGCQTDTGSFTVTFVDKGNCDVCVRLTIDGGECSPVGVIKGITVNIETNDYIGGFDLLLKYDASTTAFQSASIVGGVVEEWEYFTYRLNSAGCGAACPPGLVRLIGIADQNDGVPFTAFSSLKPQGQMINIRFLISNDPNLADQFIPISFVWYDCGDNTFSDPDGLNLYLENRIFNPELALIWDEEDNNTYPDSIRPNGQQQWGVGDECLVGGELGTPIRCVEFINGGICINPTGAFKDRGDINVNGVPYEIADAVVFSNYFIIGLAAFTIDPPRQIAATDVNADGLSLTVADLVLLIRIINGDEDPLPKRVPYVEKLGLTNRINNSIMTVTSEAVADIGAALFVYQLVGDVWISNIKTGPDARDMQLKYSVSNNQLRLLIFDLETDRIEEGINDIIEISFTGGGRLEFVEADIVDYQGRSYDIDYKGLVLPHEFSLEQNYPNPFNPSTQIIFALPVSSDWMLNVYNITGELVRSFSGRDDIGRVSVEWDGRNSQGSMVASGVYFYRLEAGQFVQSRKMILIK